MHYNPLFIFFEQVGGAVAYLQTGLFSARRYVVLLVSSVLVITWINLRCVYGGDCLILSKLLGH